VWKRARDVFAGPEQIKKARDLGQSLLEKNVDPNELPFLTASYGNGEMVAMREGLRGYLDSQLGRPGVQEPRMVKQLLGRNNQQNIRWTIGDEPADELIKGLNYEHDMHNSPRNLLQNSQTAEKTTDRQRWQSKPASSMLRTASLLLRPKALLKEAAGQVLDAHIERVDAANATEAAQIRDDAARIYTMQGPERDAVLPWILENGDRLPKRRHGGKVSKPQNHPVIHGARLAPDGHYYVNDPNRPGKFLRIVERARRSAA
jgi:hypothetical protein